jgi:hypothetical protein
MNPKASAQKNIGYSYESYRKYFFCQRAGKQPKRQPISGCITLDNL